MFAWLPGQAEGRFVPAGLLSLTETVGANPQNRELASRFAYGPGYLKRPVAIEVHPVRRGLADRDAVRGPALTEGRLPYVSGFTLVACSEFESRNKGYHAFVRDPSLGVALAQAGGWQLSPLYDVVPRPGVAYERMLHLEVGEQGKPATLDNALSRFAAVTPSRARALEIIRRVWGEVREWKTTFELHGASGLLVDQLAAAFRALDDIASPKLAGEIRSRGKP